MPDWYDETWALFLDRDGVINRRPRQDYVRNVSDWEFLDGVPQAVAALSRIFNPIVIVTNQQGIGKGLMTESDLSIIHQHMLQRLLQQGGRIDAVYYCPMLKTRPNNCRKPGNAMAHRAQADFPHIDFRRSVMVGDTPSDMQFGKNLDMFTVWINSDVETPPLNLIDECQDSLWDWVCSLKK